MSTFRALVLIACSTCQQSRNATTGHCCYTRLLQPEREVAELDFDRIVTRAGTRLGASRASFLRHLVANPANRNSFRARLIGVAPQSSGSDAAAASGPDPAQSPTDPPQGLMDRRELMTRRGVLRAACIRRHPGPVDSMVKRYLTGSRNAVRRDGLGRNQSRRDSTVSRATTRTCGLWRDVQSVLSSEWPRSTLKVTDSSLIPRYTGQSRYADRA
jgi:hypothetical protein